VTRLVPSKPLRRQTDVKERGDLLVIELFPLYLRIRTKGAKTGYNLPYGAAYDLARKIAARAELPTKVRK
jgi:hypothetical protein